MDNDRLIKLLTATAETMGATPTLGALMITAEDLRGYPDKSICVALKSLRQNETRFTTAGIFKYLKADDGRPNPDKAWSMMPKTEEESAVLTHEMVSAWAACSALYYGGDEKSAHIAFVREYKALLDKSRAEGVPPEWFLSSGHDKSGRDMAVIDAISDGRLEASKGLPFIESESNKIIALKGAVNSGLLTSSDAKLMLPPPDNYPKEKAKENLNKIKDMMKGVAAYD